MTPKIFTRVNPAKSGKLDQSEDGKRWPIFSVFPTAKKRQKVPRLHSKIVAVQPTEIINLRKYKNKDTFPDTTHTQTHNTYIIHTPKKRKQIISKMVQDKHTEAVKDTTPLMEAPPQYTPRTGSPINPPPPQTTTTTTTPPAASSSTVTPERVHSPTAPFSDNLVQIGPEPTNVVCPRCHYGVRTNTKARAGTHAGYPPHLHLSFWEFGFLICVECGLRFVVLRVELLLRFYRWSSPLVRTSNILVLIVLPPALLHM